MIYLMLAFVVGSVLLAALAFAVVRYLHLRGLDKQALDSLKKDVQDKVSNL